MVSRVEAKNLLQSLQGSHPRAAVGSVKTTTTETLEVVLCFTPVELAAIGAAGFTVRIQIEPSGEMGKYRVRTHKT
jgi:hypothetical protein